MKLCQADRRLDLIDRPAEWHQEWDVALSAKTQAGHRHIIS
jgi:hypothetical protein